LHAPSAVSFRILLYVLIGVLFAGATVASAQVNQIFEEQGVSPRDTAMGNAFTGVANDYSAAFYNPAGLYQVRKTHFSVGYKYVQPALYLSMPTNYGLNFTDYPGTRMLTLGLASDLNFPRFLNPKITNRVFFGLAIGISNYLKSFSTYIAPEIPYFPRYADRLVSLLSIYASLSIRITDWLAVGVGMVPATSSRVSAAVITKTDLFNMRWRSDQAIISRTVTIAKPVVGVLFKPPAWWFRDHLSIGLVWRDEVLGNDGTGSSRAFTQLVFPDGTEYKDIPYADNPVYGITGFSPQQVAVGLGVYPIGGMTIAIDEVWKRWSRWRNFMGLHPDPPWEDTFQTRIGIEHVWRFNYMWLYSVAVRGGWYYEPSPAPDRPSDWNLMDNDKHVVSAGLGMEMGHLVGLFMAPVAVDIAYQQHILQERTDGNPGDDLFPRMRYGGYLYALSASATFKF
jgi:long-chain fatty acid transport protein